MAIYEYDAVSVLCPSPTYLPYLPTLPIYPTQKSHIQVDSLFYNDDILCISIYLESGGSHKVPFGKCATVYSGVADLQEILDAEVRAKRADDLGQVRGSDDLKTATEEELESGSLGTGNGEMLVTVSASEEIRDSLQAIVQGHLDEKVRLMELDYQPPQK